MAYSGEGNTSAARWRALCSVALIGGAVVGACGGESRRTLGASPPATTTDTPPLPSDAPPSPTDAPPSPSATNSAPAPTTPSTPTCTAPDPPPSLNCPAELLLDVDPRIAETTVSAGVRIEPIQEPEFPDPVVFPPGAAIADRTPDPATWDRSAVPAGACVFRLWGVNAACYPAGGSFFSGSCAAVSAGGPLIAPGSYYDGNACGPAPGCPSAEPYQVESGYWWYFGDSGIDDNAEVFTDLVICAPECANSFAQTGGCLRLRAKSSR